MKFLISLFSGRASRLAQAADRIYKLQMQAEADARLIKQQEEEIFGLHIENRGYLQAVAQAQGETDIRTGEMEALKVRAETAVVAANDLQKKKDEAERLAGLAFKQMETYQDAVKMLVERGGISAIEVAQLNLGTFIPGVGGLPPTVEFGAVAEAKTSMDFGMKSQATEAKYRQVKQHFRQYQAAITVLLNQMNDLGRSNVVTKEDLRKLRQLRFDLSAQISRTI